MAPPAIHTAEPNGASTAVRVRTSEALRDELTKTPESLPGFDANAMFGPRDFAGSATPKP